LEAKDIPAAWNAKYTEYLGVTPSCDKEGCLQDMHWAGGSLGYFPTYALGSAYAAQIMAAMEKDLDVDAAIRENRLCDVVAWLGDHLHTYGASRYPKELLRIATGEDFDPTYYVDYLTKKYTEIYGL
jgi:carboxypeptidase Taq